MAAYPGQMNVQPPPYYPVGVQPYPSGPPQYENVRSPYYVPPQPVQPPPYVAHERRRPPPKSSRCVWCGSCTGVILAILAILGIAVWLGLKYGPSVYNAITNSQPGSSSDNSGQYTPYTPDTCPSNVTYCNGVLECSQGSDELGCVVFGNNNELLVKYYKTQTYLPVCAASWSNSYSQTICSLLGFNGINSSSSITDQPASFLTVAPGRSNINIQGDVSSSSNCPGQAFVSLQCSNCGRQMQSQSRIIGGTQAPLGKWPWQASLHYSGSPTCGGSIVSPTIIISAAHCFYSNMYDPTQWKVYVGTVNQNNLPPPIYVSRIIINSQYDSNSHDNDVAILILQTSISYTNNIQPVCLPTSSQTFSANMNCWTTGFGTTQYQAQQGSTYLMQVSVNIINYNVCNGPSVYNGVLTSNMICAGNLNGKVDSCQGDSGGPLVCYVNQSWYLAGITSWGRACALANSPGVYTNVANFLPWIYSVMEAQTPKWKNVMASAGIQAG
uniref:Transmembrane serine protease 13 n=1 Tax=Erpetoichthys calabaricus TaxID=27687 RepID=A0A8C4SPG3_ERPCA